MSHSSELEANKMDDESSPAVVEVNSNSEASAGEKRKHEGQSGSSKRMRSRVWDHFTKIVKEDGQSDKCQCNHCHKLFSCSSRSGTAHLLRHVADGICPAYKKDKDIMVTISSHDSPLFPWPYSQVPVQYTADADPAPPQESSKQTEDNVDNDGHGQTRLRSWTKLPAKSASKYQHNGEALMEEFGSFASKLVELVTERVTGTSRAANSGTDYSISAAVKCLNEFKDIPQSSEMYLDAVEILEDAGERECFLCLPQEPRRRWLQRVLHRRHPLRYSSKM